MSGDVLTVEGTVVEVVRDVYKVRIQLAGRSVDVVARISGRLFVNRIRVIAGDRVEVELSPYDLTKGRITRRYLDGRRAAS